MSDATKYATLITAFVLVVVGVAVLITWLLFAGLWLAAGLVFAAVLWLGVYAFLRLLDATT